MTHDRRLDQGGPPPERDPRRARRLLAVALGVAVVAAIVAAVALEAARRRYEQAQRDRLVQAAQRGPRVMVVPVAEPPGERTVTLPGDVRAFEVTTLFARVGGYLAEIRVDKGYRVRRGEVLGRIASPETDQQVQGARATLDVARRNAARARRLAPRGIVSAQELDLAETALRTADAEHRRVKALQEYEVLRAPFDGVVTARYADPGALLSATGSGQPVVEVSAPERVRILVYVGQDVAPFVRLGDAGEVTLDQQPGAVVAVRVRRMADALDPRSRSMLVELWPEGDDPAFRLVPGLFVHASLHVRIPPLPAVPPEALVARGERLQAAVVQDGKLHFVDVEPGMDDGRTVQIRRGLRPGQLVALSPPSDLGEGAPVQPITPEQLRQARDRPSASRPEQQRAGRAPR